MTALQEDEMRSWPVCTCHTIYRCCQNAWALNSIRKRRRQPLIGSLEFCGESCYGFATNMWLAAGFPGRCAISVKLVPTLTGSRKSPWQSDLQGLNPIAQNAVSRNVFQILATDQHVSRMPCRSQSIYRFGAGTDRLINVPVRQHYI